MPQFPQTVHASAIPGGTLLLLAISPDGSSAVYGTQPARAPEAPRAVGPQDVYDPAGY